MATSTVRYIREYLMRRKSPAPDFQALDAEADQALDAARSLHQGRERTEALKKAGLTRGDISYAIPHQANRRIIDAAAKQLEMLGDKVVITVDRYGNTSAGAVAIALDQANRTGRMKVGDYVLLVVFGGGLTWASSVIQW